MLEDSVADLPGPVHTDSGPGGVMGPGSEIPGPICNALVIVPTYLISTSSIVAPPDEDERPREP